MWLAERGTDLDAATVADLRLWLNSLRQAAVTRNRARAGLIAYFRFLQAFEVREDNPALSLKRLKERRATVTPLQGDDPVELIAAAYDYSPMFGALASLYLFTGLRLSELVTLRWRQIRGEWAILVQKGGNERSVYLPPAALRALTVWRVASPGGTGGWVFPSSRRPGHPITGGWVERKLGQIGASAGIPDVRPHRLRHTFGQTLYDETEKLELVREALGHVSIASTQVYAKARPRHVAEAVGALRYRGQGPMGPRAISG